jgi:hypothetical protein
MISSRRIRLNAQKFVETFHKLTDELRSSIADDDLWDTEILPDVISIGSSYTETIDFFIGWD